MVTLSPLAFQVWQGSVIELTAQVRAFALTKQWISESLQFKYLHGGWGYIVINDLKKTAGRGLCLELNGVLGTKPELVCYMVFFI